MIYKLFECVLLARLSPLVEPNLPKEQVCWSSTLTSHPYWGWWPMCAQDGCCTNWPFINIRYGMAKLSAESCQTFPVPSHNACPFILCLASKDVGFHLESKQAPWGLWMIVFPKGLSWLQSSSTYMWATYLVTPPKKFAYADDLALATPSNQPWRSQQFPVPRLKGNGAYFIYWCLHQNPTKTPVTAFYLETEWLKANSRFSFVANPSRMNCFPSTLESPLIAASLSVNA